jgi:predicted outer membrane protein
LTALLVALEAQYCDAILRSGCALPASEASAEQPIGRRMKGARCPGSFKRALHGVEERIVGHPGRERTRRDFMPRKRLTAMFAPLFVTAITGAAFAATPAEKSGNLGEVLTVLHAVGQWSIDLSKMADTRAKSDLVKSYASDMATRNSDLDAKLMAVAQKRGVEVAPLDAQTEEGKSLLERINAETTLLGSLQGDAFDKEYMTLVTNTQQSVIHFLQAHKAAAKDPDVKQLLGDMTATVQKRLKTAQDVMAKVYGDKI